MNMATLSPRLCPKPYRNRCVSLPVRSHPCVGKIQEQLCKLRSMSEISWNSKTTILTCLSGLTGLYRCFDDLFKSSDIQQILAQARHQILTNQLLEVSLKYLDVCSSAKDVAGKIKKNVLELQSALRRSKKGGEICIDGDVNAYVGSRKEIKKEIARSLVLTKETEAITLEGFPLLREVNHQVSAMVKVMQETSDMSCVVFHSVLTFLSSPGVKPKHRGWGLVLKFVKKGAEGKGEKGFCHELEAMEAELGKLVNEAETEENEEHEKIQRALVGSEAVESAMEELEEGLEGLFKAMIQARVSLLNILSI
ncbi:PREDICTED: uncharacterized protein LOC104819728 [Tarenaya hassleriana]|uniref:uncharacterized protein LOC104819728 n=1 Tax=Tarenaya hassleriana TaxID=28532 RepID=UPI00053C62A4|nr:PREDICTED: uncharacterized protein LOC104819728 [Tarenaya hassleriana]